MLPQTYPVYSSLFTFLGKLLVMSGMKHMLVECEEKNDGNDRSYTSYGKNGILPSRAAQAMWLRR